MRTESQMPEVQSTKRLIFVGRILPERESFTLPKTFHDSLRNESAGFAGELSIMLAQSQITVFIDVTGFASEKLSTIHNNVLDHVSYYVDIIGFAYGSAHTIELTLGIDPEARKTYLLTPGSRTLSGLATSLAVSPGASLEQGLFIPFGMNGDSHLVAALAELRRSLQYPAHTGFHCFRALEHLRAGVDPGSESKSPKRRLEGWYVFRSALRVHQNLQDYIERASDSPRHGSLPFISGERRLRLMEETWKTVDRYIWFIKNGKTPLTEEHFPTMTRQSNWPAQ